MSESAAPPKFTLLYAILTPVMILPVLVILILCIRGDRADQLYNRALELTTEKKYTEAAQAFREAGSHGHGESFYCLAKLYESGALAVPDAAKAVWENLQRAAINGSIQAEYELGRLAETAPEPDYANAALHYRRAALDGHREAQLAMGKFYENGLGVNQSNALAIEFYRYAAAQGMFDANAALAALYLSGSQDKVDYNAARKILLPAVKANHPRSCTLMGYVYENAQPENEENRQLAGAYYRRAYNLGDAEGGVNYGDWLLKNAREQEAQAVFLKTFERHKFAPAAHRLGVYYCGENSRNHTKARQYFESAAAQGYAASWINLGIMAELGQGGSVDMTRARECYSMAEKLNHPQAAEYLKKFSKQD